MLSFVVPAHNEERELPRALAAIHAAAQASALEYEIVVADDASTDATAEVAREHGARVVAVAHRNIAATRNSGARASVGTRIVFVDADTAVDAQVVGAAIAALDAGAVGGGAAFRFDPPVPLWARILTPVFTLFLRWGKLAAGCFVYCTRSAFEASGGFDEKMFGAEELDLSRRLRRIGRFVVVREAVLTSGRKLRTYGGWELVRTLVPLMLKGRRSVRSREGLEILYGERRSDPRQG